MSSYIQKMAFSFLFLLALSGCTVIEAETSERMSFSCRGSTRVTLGDYCRSVGDDTLKILIENRHLEEVRRVDVVVDGPSRAHESSKSASLDIDEFRIFDIEHGPGRFDTVEIIPFFLSTRGLESCRPIELDFDSIRECTDATQEDDEGLDQG